MRFRYFKRDDVTPIAMAAITAQAGVFVRSTRCEKGADAPVYPQGDHSPETMSVACAVAAALQTALSPLLKNPIGTTAVPALISLQSPVTGFLFNTQIEMCDALTDPTRSCNAGDAH
ncbi:hypothetical protein KCP70_00790 [Salmonella enterica subsp. enterica]|nr:hypothetical protein KCP70_00790 [Salmonella enterica subsp. enterica]